MNFSTQPFFGLGAELPENPANPDRKDAFALEVSQKKGFLDGFFNFISSNTIIRGAAKSWDRTRLLSGKLAKLAEIGENPVQLRSKEGTCLSGSHLLHESFSQKLHESQGALAKVCVELKHPLAPKIKPAALVDRESKTVLAPAARIKYSRFLEPAFADVEALQECLKKARLIAVWESSFEPVADPANLVHGSGRSREDNILILPKRFFLYEVEQLKSKLEIKDESSFDSSLSDFFSGLGESQDAIYFEDTSNPFLEVLENLKIEQSPWKIIKTSKGAFLLKDTNPLLSLLIKYDDCQHPLLDITIEKKPLEDPSRKEHSRGVVVLSMNQTNSYTQYTHEILTFLLSGMDVFAYDNAGKGLSVGSNSEAGLIEAIYLSGLYLKQFGYEESQILFKGQCAGGIPTSTAPTFFPRSHVWIDQAPNSFGRVAVDIFQKMVEDGKERSKLAFLASKSMGVLSPIASSLTKCLLPGIDIIENAAIGSGLFVYSMGIPDEHHQGGDKLVPKEDVDEIVAKLGTMEKEAVFLPIVGGTHVTDWWIDPALFAKITRILKAKGIMVSNFE